MGKHNAPTYPCPLSCTIKRLWLVDITITIIMIDLGSRVTVGGRSGDQRTAHSATGEDSDEGVSVCLRAHTTDSFSPSPFTGTIQRKRRVRDRARAAETIGATGLSLVLKRLSSCLVVPRRASSVRPLPRHVTSSPRKKTSSPADSFIDDRKGKAYITNCILARLLCWFAQSPRCHSPTRILFPASVCDSRSCSERSSSKTPPYY